MATIKQAPALDGKVHGISELTPGDRDRMFQLLHAYFHGVTRSSFEIDLAEKEWCVLLRDADTGTIQGFSTLTCVDTTSHGDSILGFFSGDTIVQRDFWGEMVLMRQWARHVLQQARDHDDAFVYWFLISSGYRTYRFLPLFFRSFYPHYKRSTPEIVQRHRHALASLKFGSQYDAGSNVVRFVHPAPLRPGISDITAGRSRDPHIAFYCRANPGHINGDQLVCLADLSLSNLTKAAFRLLSREDRSLLQVASIRNRCVNQASSC